MAEQVVRDVDVRSVCSDFLYDGSCSRMMCPRTHIGKSIFYMDSHCHLDLLTTWDKCGGFQFDKLVLPSNFAGCVTNFAFPRLHYLLHDLLKPEQLMRKKIFSTVGCHPKKFREFNMSVLHEIECLVLKESGVVAIGECGLDFSNHVQSFEVERQKQAFGAQMRLAAGKNVPIVIHCRDAEEITFEMIHQYLDTQHKIHLHCYTGSVSVMNRFISSFKNLKIGLTNIITKHDVSSDVIDIVRNVPLDRLLLETDSPHFVPGNNYGGRLSTMFSHPGQAINVAVKFHQMNNLKLKTVLNISTSNCKYMYDL
ncbi:TatD DNase family protein [Mytilus galloprovincialis]|uniref:TatD DNase family protein n=2 Tax=Mytilus TaxID=6548 RepID=A0A8B6DWQ2_MYTGA|nr:TatD DNase family protein [Mytilus galloprovincialis]